MNNHTNEMKKEKTTNFKLKALDMAYIAMFTAIISVCAWLSIPMQIPFTMQTFAIFATLFVLGGYKGTLSVLVYLMLGAVGVPVFAGFSGGFGALVGMTGGYLVGFLAIGLLYWLITSIFGDKLVVSIIAMVIGLAVCYLLGTLWFVFVSSSTANPYGFVTALSLCVVPYIIPDLVKMVLAIVVGTAVKKHVRKK